jgi:hypothetical protein
LTFAGYVEFPAATGCRRPHPFTVTNYDLDLTRCPDPECGAVAEVAHRWTLGSTSGALPMAHTVCLRRHVFVLPASWLPEVSPADLAR